MSNIMKMQKGLADNEQAMKQAIEAGKKQAKTAERMEQIPTFYNMGITSPELLGVAISEMLGEAKPIHKGTISNIITDIKKTQPDRLTEPSEKLSIDEQRKLLEEYLNKTAQKQTDTPQAPQKPETAPEPQEPIKSTPAEEKSEEKPNTKQEKRVMGFRADVNKIDLWKIYAEATGQEIGVMCTAAIDEYISNHELTADQRQIFDIKIKALEAEKRIKAKSR